MLFRSLTAGKAGGLNFTIQLQRETAAQTDYNNPAHIVMRGRADFDGVIFECHVTVRLDGGKAAATAGGVQVTGANSATLILTAATSYSGALPPTPISAFERLREAHVAEHRRLFRRASIELDGEVQPARLPRG